MSEMLMHKCGACVGCDMEASVHCMVARLDALMLPKLQSAHEEVHAHREAPREVVRSYVRQLQALEEQRYKMIGHISRQYGMLAGCVRPRIEVAR